MKRRLYFDNCVTSLLKRTTAYEKIRHSNPTIQLNYYSQKFQNEVRRLVAAKLKENSGSCNSSEDNRQQESTYHTTYLPPVRL
jgi:predicted metal-dependent hydrolase